MSAASDHTMNVIGAVDTTTGTKGGACFGPVKQLRRDVCQLLTTSPLVNR